MKPLPNPNPNTNTNLTNQSYTNENLKKRKY